MAKQTTMQLVEIIEDPEYLELKMDVTPMTGSMDEEGRMDTIDRSDVTAKTNTLPKCTR